ncbi:MAG: hypothetical protein JNM67_11920 [Bacteroidetes bacterium]|nr:hypothetical protein [Bacteroidota bacterium]
MKKISQLNLKMLLVYILLAFPMFYFVYKFGVLLQGYKDAESYLKLYENLSSPDVEAPFNMRLISATIIHYMDKLGLMYYTECSIDQYPQFDKSLFFNNVFLNFFCIALTGFSLFKIFVKLGFNPLMAFLSGVIYLLGFGTIFYLMMPGPDALSVLIFTWVVYFYIRKSNWIIPLFVALILQREYFFLSFMVIAFMDWWKLKDNYYIKIFGVNLACFLLYVVLRKTIFHTPHWSHQLTFKFFWYTLFNSDLQIVPLIKQSMMTMNVYLIYIFILVYKKIKGLSINKHHLITTLLMLAQITFLSFVMTFGTNNGRYFYLNIPYFLYLMHLELKPFYKDLLQYNEEQTQTS